MIGLVYQFRRSNVGYFGFSVGNIDCVSLFPASNVFSLIFLVCVGGGGCLILQYLDVKTLMRTTFGSMTGASALYLFIC